MIKFEEEFDKKVEIFNVFGNHNSICCEADQVKEKFADWQPQQALPVVPECAAVAIKSLPDNCSAFEAISLINAKIGALPEENEDWLPVFNWLCDDIKNQDIFALAFITGKYEVEKPQLFKLIFPNSTAVLQKDGELNSFAARVYKRYLIGNAMTEQDIKSIDERYWQFAVPVEDGE